MEMKELDIRDLQPFGPSLAFDSQFWLDIYGNRLKIFSVESKKGVEVARFFLITHQIAGQKVLMQPQFTWGSGFYFHNFADKLEARQTQIKRMMRSVAEGLKYTFPNHILDFSLPAELTDMQPFLWEGYQVTTRYTYLVDIAKQDQELLSAMSTSRRKNILDAEKKSFSMHINAHSDRVLELVKGTFDRQEQKYPFEVFSNLVKSGIQNGKILTVLVESEGKDLACAVNIYDKNKSFYIGGGYNNTANDHTAGPYTIWKSWMYLKNAGVETYNFCGSMIPDIEKYFRGFGGEIVPYFRMIHNGGTYGNLIQMLRRFKG